MALEIAAFGVVGAVLIYQALIDLGSYVEVAGGIVKAQEEFGNLLGPLDPLHVLGVWLSGDYRIPPARSEDYSNILSGIVAGAFAIGLVGVLRRRAWAALTFVGVSLLAYWYVTKTGSPWADGKAMMILSPAIMFGAAAGAGFLHQLGQRVLAWGVAALLVLGVVWSNALQFHDVSLAPRDRMEELAGIGEQFDGQGPSLYTEAEEFGKHFLRQTAPEGSAEGWQRALRRVARPRGAVPAVRLQQRARPVHRRLRHLLPHDRAAARLLREPAAVDLSARVPRPLLRRLAACARRRARPDPARGARLRAVAGRGGAVSDRAGDGARRAERGRTHRVRPAGERRHVRAGGRDDAARVARGSGGRRRCCRRAARARSRA